jgi:hypothetical protein
MGGEGESGVWRWLARCQVGDDLAEQGGELGAVAGTRRSDHEWAGPVEDEVLVSGRGVEAGHLVDGIAGQPGHAPLDERDRAGACRRIDSVVAVSRRGDLTAVDLAHLDRAGDLSVAAARQAVTLVRVVPEDEGGPGAGRGAGLVAGGEVEDLLLGYRQGGEPDEVAGQRGEPCADSDRDDRGGERAALGVHQRAAAARARRQAGYRRVEADVGTAGGGQPEHRGHRAVRVEHAGVGVEHDLAGTGEGDERPAFGRLAG